MLLRLDNGGVKPGLIRHPGRSFIIKKFRRLTVNKDYRKSELLQARLIPLEMRAVLEIAQEEKLNLAETVRMLVRAEAKRRGLWPLQNTRASMHGEEHGKVE